MDTDEALAVLGIKPGARAEEARAAYLRLIRVRHPDRAGAGPDATHQTARLTQAYSVIRAALAESVNGVVPPSAGTAPVRPSPPPSAPGWPFDPTAQPVGADVVDSDTIAVDAPADEAFAVLFEAAGRVGHVAYFDRQLGILETIVRFEGGPTCSVLITLQGRALTTEAFCTMESIEAAPTPPIRPVVEALVHELVDPTPDA